MFLGELELVVDQCLSLIFVLNWPGVRGLCMGAYARQECRNKERGGECERDYGRGDQSLGAVHVEVLRPHGEPPWVRGLLLVEDIEGVCACAEDGDAEYNYKTREDCLREMERRRVDLHDGGL